MKINEDAVELFIRKNSYKGTIDEFKRESVVGDVCVADAERGCRQCSSHSVSVERAAVCDATLGTLPAHNAQCSVK